jgi:hypothetical protein
MTIEEIHNINYEITQKPKIDYELLFTKINTIITARDGIGKTTFTIRTIEMFLRKNPNDFIPIYLDADDKSIEQRKIFKNIFEKMKGFYINLHSYLYKTNKKSTFKEFILEISNKLDKSKKYCVILDNWSKIVGSLDENNNNEVRNIILDLEPTLLKAPNIFVKLIAHAGKEIEKGVRGASELRSVFALEIILYKSIHGNIIAQIRKDSFDFFKNRPLSHIVKIEGENMITLKPETRDIITTEQLKAYRSWLLDNIIGTVFVKLKHELDDKVCISVQTIQSIANVFGNKNTDFGGPDYLSSSFINSNIIGSIKKYTIINNNTLLKKTHQLAFFSFSIDPILAISLYI